MVQIKMKMVSNIVKCTCATLVIIVSLLLNIASAKPQISAANWQKLKKYKQAYLARNGNQSRRKLARPLRFRVAIPQIGRARFVFNLERSFSSASKTIYLQGYYRIGNGPSFPTALSWDGSELIVAPLVNRRSKAVQLKFITYRQNNYEMLSVNKRTDFKFESFRNCPLDFSRTESNIRRARSLTVRTAAIEMEADAELVALKSNTSEYIQSLLNAVEVIYQRDLLINFTLKKEEYFSDSNTQPYTELQGENLLTQVAQNNLKEKVDLTHLVTGKNIYISDPSDGLAGIAYIGSVCAKSANVGLSEYRSNLSTVVLTMAHEVGHNFNARHPTVAEGFIMDATGSDSTKSEFSEGSKAEIADFVASSSASCLVTSDVVAPTLSVTTKTKNGQLSFNIDFGMDRSACTFLLQLAGNDIFTGTTYEFTDFVGTELSTALSAKQLRKSSKNVYARIILDCSGTEIPSEAVKIPKVKKISSDKEPLGLKKWIKLKKMKQL